MRFGKVQCGAESLDAVPPHPNLMTRSLPLARPSRACGFAAFLSPLPKRLKSLGEKGLLYQIRWAICRDMTESRYGTGHTCTSKGICACESCSLHCGACEKFSEF